ncbi:MAG: SufE family protein [Arachidicoccus sp.]|nr:SufE family protein [Arachidicoccus sp.]
MDINKIQDKIIQEFNLLADRVGRFKYFRYIAHVGSQLPTIHSDDKTDDNVVKGCKSKIWLKARCEEGKIFFETDSENKITKGIAGLLTKVFSGQSPQAIINSNLYFLNEINLYDRLNATWTREVQTIMQRMKSLAIRFRTTSLAV